jgi:hypothetical protein
MKDSLEVMIIFKPLKHKVMFAYMRPKLTYFFTSFMKRWWMVDNRVEARWPVLAWTHITLNFTFIRKIHTPWSQKLYVKNWFQTKLNLVKVKKFVFVFNLLLLFFLRKFTTFSVPNYKSLWKKNLYQIINRFTLPMKHLMLFFLLYP